MQVMKKNQEIVLFEREKIKNAIIAAYNQIERPQLDKINHVCSEVEERLLKKYSDKEFLKVEDIENEVIAQLFLEIPEVGRQYTSYKLKKERAKVNPTEIEKVLFVSPEIAQENANKDVTNTHIKNSYLAEIPSRQLMRELLPTECLEAHDRGVVYAHDLSYSARDMHNCDLINLEELFKGCEINKIWIDTPKSFKTACTVTTQALTHVTNNQYGGVTINLLHLAKFVDVSRKKIHQKYEEYNLNEEVRKKIEEDELNTEIKDGMQTFLYQNNTLCAGTGQAVFLSVAVYLNEEPEYTDDLILVFKEMLRQRIKGIKNKDGFYENPNFPKILYFLDEDTMKGGKYYDVTKLCAECSSKRLTPDYLSVKKHLELKGVVTPSMGCRSLLSPYKNEKNEYVTWGRFNLGVQTLNLPYIAMENNYQKDETIFWKNLDKYLDIAYRDMIWRIDHISRIKAKACPLLWQHGALTRLSPEENLSKVVYGGYATISLGYSGLYECVKYITSKNHWEDGEGKDFALKILDYLNRKNEEFTNEYNVSVGLYATPMETLTDKFAKACIRDFGHIGDGTQRHYETNGYHIPVFQKINAFEKLSKEAPFSNKTLGGSISYVEVPNMTNNQEAILELIEHIGNTCLYAEINSEISCCKSCGFEGYDFNKLLEKDGTIRWQCPQCGEKRVSMVQTSYRVCGYISNYTPNQGRSEDILNRVKHLNLEN